MNPTRMCATALFTISFVAGLAAQIPDGYIVWSSQQGTAGQNGIFYSHPRDPLVPVGTIHNLPPALAYDPAGARGGASVLYRTSDGALLAGERAPNGTSVDLHVLHLHGDDVYWAQSFSVGTGIAFGEICQAGLLPDGRVVVAASGLAPGSALAQALTTNYQWEGLGIIDTISGSVTPIPVANLAQIAGVLNGVAVAADGATIYFCTWITNASGEVYRVPTTGGTATLLAAVPGGPASLAFDNDGQLVMPSLMPNSPNNVFRCDPVTGALTPVPTTAGPLNCLAVEAATGNYLCATRETGTPPRSLYWMTPGGTQTLLGSPNLATINGISSNPNPEIRAAGSPGALSYDWRVAPNPGGLPLVGSNFSLTLAASAPTSGVGVAVIGFQRLATPLLVQGAAIHVDPTSAFGLFFAFQDELTLPFALPNSTGLRGIRVYAQTVHDEGTAQLAASSLVEFTTL